MLLSTQQFFIRVSVLCLLLVPHVFADIEVIINEPSGTYETTVPGDVSLSSTPINYRVIERESFINTPAGLAEVLKQETGVQIRQSGGLGSYSEVSLRGASSQQVMIYLDGVPLNEASGGGVDLSLIPLDSIERIEIYEGATPLELGNASMGGAINLISRRAGADSQTQMKLGLGSFQTQQFDINTSGSHEQDRYWLGVGYLGSENNYPTINNRTTSDRSEGLRQNADFAQNHWLIKWDKSLNARWGAGVIMQGFNKEQGLPDVDNNASLTARFETKNIKLQSYLHRYAFDDSDTAANTKLFFHQKTETYDDRAGQIGLGFQHAQMQTNKLGLSQFVDYNFSGFGLGINSELSKELSSQIDLRGQLEETLSSRDSLLLGLELNKTFFDKHLLSSLTLRQQWTEDKLEKFDAPSGTQPSVTNKRYDNFSPQIGLKYYFSDLSNFKTNLGRYARQPAFYELFGDKGYFVGKQNLQVEEGTNFDISFNHEWVAVDQWYHQARVNLTLFHNRAENLIVRIYDARGVGRADNISDAEIDGINLDISIKPTNNFEIFSHAAWQETKMITDVKAFDGNQLPGKFAEKYSSEFIYSWAGVQIKFEYEFNRGLYYDRGNELPALDQELLHMSMQWRLNGWLIDARIDNVLDNETEDFNGFFKPRRQLFASASIDF